jgi:hypothetical protein
MRDLLFVICLLILSQNVLLLKTTITDDIALGFAMSENYIREDNNAQVSSFENMIMQSSGVPAESTTSNENIANSESLQTTQIAKNCELDNNTTLSPRERVIEYIEINVPQEQTKVCKKRRPAIPQPEQVIYGPFYSQDIVTEKDHHLREHNETEIGGLGFQERAETVFEEELEKREDEALSKLIAKQNETIEKTKKAKKKQKQLKKIIEVEYKKGIKRNTKYLNELKHELDKAMNRVEELQTEAVLANELIKEVIDQAHNEELRKAQADEFVKEVEIHLDQERLEEDAALERLVEMNKQESSFNKRLDEINSEQCSAAERRTELYQLTHHVEESKQEIIAELKTKLDNLSQEVQFENDTKARLCDIKKELVMAKQNVENVQEEIKHSEQRNFERSEEQNHTISRVETEKIEISSEEHRREESESMEHTVEERLSQLNQRKALIGKMLMQETEIIKRDVKKKKSGKRVLDELSEKRNKARDYLKSQNIVLEGEHIKEEESHDAISDMLKQLQKGEYRSLESSYSAKKEDSVHAKLDESSEIESTADLEESEEYKEFKSQVSESTLEHTLQEEEREAKFEVVKQESIDIAVAQVVADSVEEDKKEKCETLMESIKSLAEVPVDFANILAQ